MQTSNVTISTIAVVAFAYVILVIIGLPFLRPDFNIMKNWMSDYAVGRYGWLQASAFIGISLGALALLIGLVRLGPKTWIARTGLVLLAVVVPGIFAAALFTTDLPGEPQTQHGLIHLIDALVNFVAALIATLFLSASFGDDPRWRSFRGVALILSICGVVALVNQFVTATFRWSGISNRVFAGVLLAWLLLTSLRLRAVAQAPGTA